MKKSSIPLFIGAFILPYVMIAVQYFFYKYGIALIVFMVTFQIISIIYNCFAAKRAVLYIILSFNLTACTVAAYIISISRYMQYVSADSETALVGKLETITGGVLTAGLSVLVYFLIRLLKKAINYEQRVKNCAAQPAERKGNPSSYSILSLVLVIVSFTAFASAAFFCARLYTSLIEISFAALVNGLLLGLCLIIAMICITLGIVFSFKDVSNNDTSQLSAALALNARLAGIAFLIAPGAAFFIISCLMLHMIALGI